jgi:hypothetical protein
MPGGLGGGGSLTALLRLGTRSPRLRPPCSCGVASLCLAIAGGVTLLFVSRRLDIEARPRRAGLGVRRPRRACYLASGPAAARNASTSSRRSPATTTSTTLDRPEATDAEYDALSGSPRAEASP